MKNIIFFLAFLTCAFAVNAQRARVKAVHDGDSYKLEYLLDSTIKWVRIIGIDCPAVFSPYTPKAQPYGRSIGDSVRALIRDSLVTVVKKYGRDPFDNDLVRVFYKDNDLAEILLFRGWAWYYYDRKLDKETRKRYKHLAAEAKKAKRGLWAGREPDAKKYTAPVRPTDWKKKNPRIRL